MIALYKALKEKSFYELFEYDLRTRKSLISEIIDFKDNLKLLELLENRLEPVQSV